jgi:Spy/CpxP family protein refolding chaperone
LFIKLQTYKARRSTTTERQLANESTYFSLEKNMIKKIATVTVLTTLLAAGIAVAKPSFDDPEKMTAWLDKRVERMTEKLSLTNDQATQMKTIMQEQMEKRKAMMEQHRKETEERFATVLNEEQMKKMQELKEKRKEMRGKRGDKHHGKGHGGKHCKH